MTPGVAAYEAYMDGVAQFTAAVDRGAFDLDALSLQTALMEPDDIVALVRDRIGFHPYTGSLRGADGALRAGAGNSLDTALLLSRLLGDSGLETRIARATLNPEQAAALTARLGRVAPAATFADPAGAQDAAAVIERASGNLGLGAGILGFIADPAGGVPAAPPKVGQEAERIVAALGPDLPGAEGLAAHLQAEVADYAWVQSRLFGADDWVDRHVLLPADTSLTLEGFIPVPVPEEMKHSVTFVAELKVREGVDTRSIPLFDTGRFTTDSAALPAPVISILPDAALKGQSDLLTAGPDSRFFFPLVNGVLPPGARAFTARGQVIPAQDVLAGGAMADLVAEVGSQLAETTDLLAAMQGGRAEDAELPPNSPVQEVLGIVLKVAYTPPGGGTRTTWERHIVDRVGPDGRAEGRITAAPGAQPTETAVLGRWTLLPAVGDISAVQLVTAQADRALGLRQDMRAVAEGGALYAFPAENPVQRLLSTHLLDRAASQGAGPGAVVYRATPGLMILRQTSAALGGGLRQAAGIDILTTGRRVLGANGAPDTAAALRAGVAETLMEYELASAILPGAGGARTPSESAWAVLSAAQSLTPVTRAQDLPQGLPPGTRAGAEADLSGGAILALAAADEGAAAWWRIDPQSGAVIGVDGLGRGGEAAEYLSLVDAIITGTFVGVGTASCTAGGGGYGCCVGTNLAWGLLGYGLLYGAGKGIEAIFLADAYTAGLIGMSVGVGTSASGWSPFNGVCS
ncbi:hypothetical protein [Oceanibium sediminis]|uniref:hypothetical protein n=1 Tax=Oceanibium sediminis TaxID=2026339 RepID=UPI000DD46575|nr:hypothetical protein [Oceanibium sediminis]